MLFCLAESKRKLQRAFLAKSAVLVLHQDVRDGKLLVRFRASDHALHVARGILGCERLESFGVGAHGLAKACRAIIQKASTALFGAPHLLASRCARAAPNLCRALEDHIAKHVEVLNADAAADEQAAARLLGKASTQQLQPYFPNLKLVKKDATHAVKRTGSEQKHERTHTIDDGA